MAWKTQKDPVASCGRDSPARRIRGTILTARCMCWTVQSWSPSPGFISCWSVLIDVDATIMPHPNPRWIIVPLHCASAACDASTTLEMEIAWSLERDWDVTKLQKSAKVYQGLPRSTKVLEQSSPASHRWCRSYRWRTSQDLGAQDVGAMGIQRARNWESSKYNENTTKKQRRYNEDTTKYTLSKVLYYLLFLSLVAVEYTIIGFWGRLGYDWHNSTCKRW